MKNRLFYFVFIVLSLLTPLIIIASEEGIEKTLIRLQTKDRANFISEEKVALVIGLSDYPEHSNIPSLSYAKNDALALEKKLTAFGYRVRILTDYQATTGAVLSVIDDLGQYLTADQGTFVFYFSGHGFAQDKANYLATYESDMNDLERTGLSLERVIDRLRATGARRHVLFIDACRDDPNTGSKNLNNPGSFKEFDLAEGTQILFSTKYGGKSYEYSQLGHGVYTYYLLQGLDGKARREDGLLTFTKLADYVSVSVKDYVFQAKQTQLPFVAGERHGVFLIHGQKRQKKRPWYKNPWVWVGMISAGSAAVYFNRDSDGGHDVETR